MEQSELLRFVVSVLERLSLAYFVTGSTVTIFYGEPRFTNDIDIVVDLPAGAVQEFCSQFPEEEFYVSQQSASDAVRRCSQFNIIQPASGLKVDVIVPPPSEFNRARFARARRVQAGEGWDASFSSPEDAILKKMEFFREGGSDKHLRDITGVLKTSGSEIDTVYIDRWAATLGLTEIWETILARVREP
ncbi:MAG: hypothetical protein ABMA15_14230 [Vicinamibacterales bacterium]